MRITLRQIAKLANVSVPTASKALHNSKDVSAQTTAEVWEVALKYGYLTEKKEATLKNQKQIAPKIAILCPEIISIHYTRRATEIARRLEEKGASVQIFICDFYKNSFWKSLRKCMESVEIDGVVCLRSNDFGFKQDIKLPYICVGNSSINSSRFGLKKAITEVIACAKQKGHMRFAFLGETLTDDKAERFKSALLRNGVPTDSGTVIVSRQRFEEAGYDGVCTLLSSHKALPTFCLCAYDEIAIGALRALHEHNIGVPDQMAVVGINNIPAAAYVVPALSSIGFEEGQLCEQVIDAILEEVLSGNQRQEKEISVPCKLYLRETFY